MSLTTTPATITFTPELAAQLRAPFDWNVIEVRPGSVRKDGTAALALAYADPRVYEERLDEVVGPEHWSVEFTPWGDHKLICRLTIGGVTKCSTGEADPKDKNAGTVAEAQAFKRACTKFGLGRYLYHLAQVWAKGSGDSHSFVFANPERIIAEMRHAYERAHRSAHASTSKRAAPPDEAHPASEPVPLSRPARARPVTSAPPQKQATARAALHAAEQRTGLAQRTTH